MSTIGERTKQQQQYGKKSTSTKNNSRWNITRNRNFIKFENQVTKQTNRPLVYDAQEKTKYDDNDNNYRDSN